MADKPDVLKRLEEIESKHDGCVDDCDEHWLLKLTRALLDSQGEPRYLRQIPGVPLTNPRYTKVANGVWDSVEGRTNYVGDSCPGGHREDELAAQFPGVAPQREPKG